MADFQGRIIRGVGGFYYVPDPQGRLIECRARGGLRQQDIRPLVGDEAQVLLTREDPEKGRIEGLLPRKNILIRPAVANVDQALILVTAARPPFHPGLLDRFLVWMAFQQVPAIIGIGKKDLGDETRIREIQKIYEGAGYPVCSFSAKTGEGLPELETWLAGKTTVLAGASGVGKSTLLNRLVPQAEMETGGLSVKGGRGRHTTRHAELFPLGGHGFLCDTPGFSALELPDMEARELADCFPEYGALKGCAFRDCLHHGEKGCVARQAAEKGLILPSRQENYETMLAEILNRRKY